MFQKIENPKSMTRMEAKAIYADKFFIFLTKVDSEFQDGRAIGFVPCVADSEREISDVFLTLDKQDELISEFGEIKDYEFGWMFGLDVYDDVLSLLIAVKSYE
jgi:hypothetical protein